MKSVKRNVIVLALPVLLLACSAGTPPPGPIDIVREIFDPDYDYRDSPETWRDSDARYERIPQRGGWSAACPDRDLSCTHEGVTVCCAPSDRCCAGRSGPFCCDGDYAGRDDRDRWYGE